jgi:hypothetical protein
MANGSVSERTSVVLLTESPSVVTETRGVSGSRAPNQRDTIVRRKSIIECVQIIGLCEMGLGGIGKGVYKRDFYYFYIIGKLIFFYFIFIIIYYN